LTYSPVLLYLGMYLMPICFFTFFIPRESWVNEAILEMRIRGRIKPFFANIQPYEEKDIAMPPESDLKNYSPVEGILAKRILSYLNKKSYGEVSFLKDTLSRSLQSLGMKRKVSSLLFSFEGIGKVGVSPEYPGLSWDSIYGIDYRRGYGQISKNSFSLLLGREAFRWGHSLLLSGSAPPFNLLFATLEYKGIKGSFFATALDPYRLDTSRFLSAHRLDFSLFSDRLLLGLSEAVLFCRQELFQGVAYLNPFSIYRLSEYNYHYGNKRLGLPYFNDDLYWQCDFAYFFPKRCIYGEVLLDDIGFIDTLTRPGFIRDLINSGPFGFIFGLKMADFIIPRSYSVIQYTRVNACTYFHTERKNYYLYMGYPIGHPKGPDFDEVYYRLLYHLSERFDFHLSLSYARRGRTFLSFDAEVPPRNCFLWVKEGEKPRKEFSLLFGTAFFRMPVFLIRADFGWSWIFNYRFKEGVKKTFPCVCLATNFYF